MKTFKSSARSTPKDTAIATAVFLILAVISFALDGIGIFSGFFLLCVIITGVRGVFQHLEYRFEPDALVIENIITKNRLKIPYETISEVDIITSGEGRAGLAGVHKVEIIHKKTTILCFDTLAGTRTQFIEELKGHIDENRIKDRGTRPYDIRFTLI